MSKRLNIYRCSGVGANLPHIDGEIEMVNKDYSVPAQQNNNFDVSFSASTVPVRNEKFDVKNVTLPHEPVEFEMTNDVMRSISTEVATDIKLSGWMRNETLRQYLGASKDGGCAEYFLYIFIPENDLAKYNATIYRKRQGQLKTYDYVRELFVGHGYGTEDELLDIIRSGIYDTFGVTVEDVLLDIRTGKREAIGSLSATVIAAIISAVVTVVLAVISGVIEYAKSVKVAKYTAPTMQELEDSAPASTDITGGAKKKGLLWAAAAGAGLLLLGAFKK